MKSPKSPDTPAVAYAKGSFLGSDLDSSARDCPYLHDQRELRGEWMRGFGDARGALKRPVEADGHG